MDRVSKLLWSWGILFFALWAGWAVACGSPTGGQIAFVAFMDGDSGDGDSEIYLVDADTGEALALTGNLNRDFSPSMSPDGKSIAYLIAEDDYFHLNLVDRQGEAITRLADNVESNQRPLWAPDGRRLAFTSLQDENPEIYLIAGEEAQQTRVTSNAAEDRLGDWSADGEWLVFYRDEDDPERGLWLRNPNGVNLVRLTEEADTGPSWSPNGNHIVFVRHEQGNADIYMVSKPSNGAWQDDIEFTRLTQHGAADISPVWSPVSSLIAFVSYRSGSAEIYIMQGDGSNQRRLTNNEADDVTPVWSPDGKRIAFVTYLYGPGEIIVMGADGSQQRRLTNNTTEDNSPDW